VNCYPLLNMLLSDFHRVLCSIILCSGPAFLKMEHRSRDRNKGFFWDWWQICANAWRARSWSFCRMQLRVLEQKIDQGSLENARTISTLIRVLNSSKNATMVAWLFFSIVASTYAHTSDSNLFPLKDCCSLFCSTLLIFFYWHIIFCFLHR